MNPSQPLRPPTVEAVEHAQAAGLDLNRLKAVYIFVAVGVLSEWPTNREQLWSSSGDRQLPD